MDIQASRAPFAHNSLYSQTARCFVYAIAIAYVFRLPARFAPRCQLPILTPSRALVFPRGPDLRIPQQSDWSIVKYLRKQCIVSYTFVNFVGYNLTNLLKPSMTNNTYLYLVDRLFDIGPRWSTYKSTNGLSSFGILLRDFNRLKTDNLLSCLTERKVEYILSTLGYDFSFIPHLEKPIATPYIL